MKLVNVERGLQDEPLLLLIYGPEGVGKSSFCAGAPRAIFLSAAKGTGELDVERLPRAESFQDVLDAIDELRTTEHTYRSLVIDELGSLEVLIVQHICRRDGKADIEAYGFGKGFGKALDEWRILASRVERLREEKRMNILLNAHSDVKTFKNPDSEIGDYDRYQLKLHSGIGGFLKEWCKAVFFAEYETFTKDAEGKRQVGVSTGRRLLHTQRTAAYDAKNRMGLPAVMDLSWNVFSSAARKSHETRKRLAVALRDATEQKRTEVQRAIEEAGYTLESYEAAIAGLGAPQNTEQGNG